MKTFATLILLLLMCKTNTFAQRNSPGKYSGQELLINGFDLTTNRINTAHYKFPLINGAGLTVSIKENKFDTSDIDFKGRYIPVPFAANNYSPHATIMATMLGGGGNSYYLGKGAAWNVNLTSASFVNLLPETDASYRQFNISVQNHSYGTAIENYYGADAAAYDVSVINNPFLVHVFSSGNSGTSTSTAGAYSGIQNFANLTGSYKMAKNIITVGATDSFANVEVLSSRGPAYDGRIKPELVAFGQDGSSGAAALVSGVAILMQQAYKELHHDSLPPAHLVKAALINSADDAGVKGPDFVSGFGSLNAYQAIKTIRSSNIIYDSISNSTQKNYDITIPPGIRRIKVSMAYSDLPAQANASKSLINDLDLELIEVASGNIFRPWVLNHSPNKDSLLLPATRKKDTLNNIEQITIDDPVSGTYQIRVAGSHVTNAMQGFAIAYSLDTADQFEWHYPVSTDPVLTNTAASLRFKSTYNATGALSYSLDGTNWIAAGSNIDLASGYFKWPTPDTFSTAFLKMTIAGKDYLSDTFLISKPPVTHVGFNCADSVLFYWNKISGATSYKIYVLRDKFLEPVASTTDTSFIFSKASIPSKHFTVAAMKNNKEGIKAYTFNYEDQGVECYFKSFLVTLDGNRAIVNIELASTYGINSLEVKKLSAPSSVKLNLNPGQLSYTFIDSNLHQGANKYYAVLLKGSHSFATQIETIYYFNNLDYIVFPNPTTASQGFTILKQDLED
ncbi:MAG TPA: S8 family serine peptidase, partial [Chitinophagaceae bacterium]|nr:S8 family serine peptidase [Chitinophagaceae bacterium]